MYQVVIGATITEYATLEELKEGFGTAAEYMPDCGTYGDILIRHPLNPKMQIRATYKEEGQ